jgi:hypothetical protein
MTTDESASTDQSQPPSAAKSRSRRIAKRLGYGLGAVLIAILAYLLLWPSPIDSVAYQPPPTPVLEGALAPNRLLESAELLALGQVSGPEDVEVDPSGKIYAGTLDGRIVAVPRVKGDSEVKTLATTGGRPLGIATAPNGDLIVADAVKGLLSVSPDGRITTLPTDVAGKPVHFADDLDVTARSISPTPATNSGSTDSSTTCSKRVRTGACCGMTRPQKRPPFC